MNFCMSFLFVDYCKNCCYSIYRGLISNKVSFHIYWMKSWNVLCSFNSGPKHGRNQFLRAVSWFFLPQPAAVYTLSPPQSQPGCSCLRQRCAHMCHFGILLRSETSTEEPLSHPEDTVVRFACVISPNTMKRFSKTEAHFVLEMLFLIWFTSFKPVTVLFRVKWWSLLLLNDDFYPLFCAGCFMLH